AALVSAGMGMGSVTVSPFAGWLLGQYDWRTTMLIIGIASLCLVLPAALLVREPPRDSQVSGAGDTRREADRDCALTAGQAFFKPQFVVIALANFACCTAHSGPIFHMVTYAAFFGLAPMVSVSVDSRARRSGLG